MSGFTTRAVHAGQEPDRLTGAVIPPVYQTSTFVQDGINVLRDGHEYSRGSNPTRNAFEEQLCALEGGQRAFAFASGIAAEDALLRSVLRPGDHVVLGADGYGGTNRLITRVLAPWQIRHTPVDVTSLDAVRGAVEAGTRVIWVETPTNPLLGIADLTGIAQIAQDAGALLIVDSTFASPYLQRPLEFGADVVVHSTTKYIGGHSDVVGGVVCGIEDKVADFHEQLRFFFGWVGANPSPFDTYLTGRGLKTLAVRMEKHCDNAEAVAKYLDAQPQVARVYYPGLASHPGHEVAKKQMTRFGGMVSLLFQTTEQAKTFCKSTKLFCLAESLGGVESLLEHPATMTHVSVAGSALEVPGELVRISVGIEEEADLIADLEQALTRL